MKPLLPGDPAWVGGHRILRRLGAGGMGVVYLARSPGAALAAVKVIRPPHADEPGFRARFRREADAARRVRHPCVVPLWGADPDAPAPWLATAFVAGPSVEEAVAACGPLPRPAVARLGADLASALGAVHGAGLVHRDVKPGNVLLALDGPRLIDFGIAREPAGTDGSDGSALTAGGAVVGSPGFLSPEQALGRGREIGPPSDVFSLGCLLAFALTGRRPFGGGPVAAVLARTVLEEPDLDGVPRELAPLLRACLDKEPAGRPGAAEAGRALAAGDDAPAGAWLPAPVTALVARRSAAALALPGVERTQPGRPAPPDAPAGSPAPSGGDAAGGAAGADTVTALGAGLAAPTRRRFLRLGVLGGVVAAGGGGVWWVRGREEPPPAAPARLRVALHADLSGTARAAGRAQENGVRLALEEAGSRADAVVRFALVVHDDGGGVRAARAVAEEIAADETILAVVGPTTDRCAAAVVDRYQEALLPMVSVSLGSAPARTLFTHRVYASTRPADGVLAAPVVAHLGRTVGARLTVLVDDLAEGDHSRAVCRETERALGRSGSAVRSRTLAADADDDRFGRLAAEVTGAGADAVVFPGGPERTARFAGALRAAGFGGARVATQRAMGPAFLRRAGRDGDGWVFATAFLDAAASAATADFAAAHRKRFDGAAPSWYAAEAYDAASFLTRALTEAGGADAERGGVVRRLRTTHHRGVTRTIRYDASAAAYTTEGLYLFRASGGRFRYLGPYEEATG
ncbi:bifunctional serine/threonine-protein kinase/ABC transporter substrate-binding protein [Streptomyces chumphonensis]|uniref:bifunctional serine/threonine-protein kinase/ABC transporter substrate-binding protein n=1 Tax=Streptomyces chumphonensis TaxID=1214925 RepID=UPI003D754BCA